MGLSRNIPDLAVLARWPSIDDHCRPLIETVTEQSFPGAIVPAITSSSELVFYALADDGPTWRRLQPLLRAFAGPTITDFDGLPTVLNHEIDLERRFDEIGFYAVAKLRPNSSPSGRLLATRALLRLRDVLSLAPVLVKTTPLPTSRLLAQFQDALNNQDLVEAWRLHGLLRSDLRLDATNLVYLEIAIYAQIQDWAAIRWHPRFDELCASVPPSATAELLLQSIYWTELKPHTSEGAKGTGSVVAFEVVRPYVQTLLPIVANVANTAIDEIRKLVLAASSAATAQSISEPTDEDSLNIELALPEPASASVPTPLEEAREALLLVAQSSDNRARLEHAKFLIESLGSSDRRLLLEPTWFRALWNEVESQLGTHSPPQSWSEWITFLSEEQFDAAGYAKKGATEWRLTDVELDLAKGIELARAIEGIPSGLADERLIAAMPYWIAWAKADPCWPRTALRHVYAELLLRLAVSARRGAAVLRAGSSLLEGLLQIGLSNLEYRDLIENVEAITLEGLNRGSVYDVLEFVELLQGAHSPDEMARNNYFSKLLPRLAFLKDRLTVGQITALNQILRVAGRDAETLNQPGGTGPNLPEILKGKRIAIYTLTESAGRQAEALLNNMSPESIIQINHDHVGTKALANLAASADIFVIAWASAKHAATDFIREHRGKKSILYASGRGASSIVRVIEEDAFLRASRH
jgi:hypothetical protein